MKLRRYLLIVSFIFLFKFASADSGIGCYTYAFGAPEVYINPTATAHQYDTSKKIPVDFSGSSTTPCGYINGNTGQGPNRMTTTGNNCSLVGYYGLYEVNYFYTPCVALPLDDYLPWLILLIGTVSGFYYRRELIKTLSINL